MSDFDVVTATEHRPLRVIVHRLRDGRDRRPVRYRDRGSGLCAAH